MIDNMHLRWIEAEMEVENGPPTAGHHMYKEAKIKL
jgi:hypothetical protein